MKGRDHVKLKKKIGRKRKYKQFQRKPTNNQNFDKTSKDPQPLELSRLFGSNTSRVICITPSTLLGRYQSHVR